MATEQKTIRMKGLMSYISKRKKPWGVAVFDKKNNKRAIGKSLSEVLVKFTKHSEELIVVNYQEWKNRKSKNNDDKDS